MATFTSTRCGIDNCRSREYHHENGLLYCSRGHQQEGRVLQEQEYEDLNPAASQTYRITDKKREEEERQEIKKLAGPRGLKLFRLAYEHVLRTQLRALIERKGFSQDLEKLGQELWALRVQIAMDGGCDLDDGSPGGVRGDDEDQVEPRAPVPSFMESFAICYLAAFILRVPLPVRKLHEWMLNEDIPYLKAVMIIPAEMKRKFTPWMTGVFTVMKPLDEETVNAAIAGFVVTIMNRFQSFKLPPLNTPPMLLDYSVRLGMPMTLYSFVESILQLADVKLEFPRPNGKQRQAYLPLCPGVQLMALIVFAVKFYFPFDDPKELYAFSPEDPAYLNLDWSKWEMHMQDLDEELAAGGPPLKLGSQMSLQTADMWDLSERQMDAYMDWFEETFLDNESEGPEASSASQRSRKGLNQYPDALLKMFPIGGGGAKKEAEVDAEAVEAECYKRLLTRVHANLKPRKIVSRNQEDARSGGSMGLASDGDGKGSKSKGRKKPIPRVGSRYVVYRREEDLKVTAEPALASASRLPVAYLFHKRAAEIAKVSISTLLKAVRIMETTLHDAEPKFAAVVARARAERAQDQAVRDRKDEENFREANLEGLPEDAF